jgi:hypothetical protein
VTSFKYISEEDDNSFQNIIYSVSDQSELVFGVMACKEAHVALSNVPGIVTHLTYELVIGMADNSLTALKNGVDGPLLSQTSSPGILDCDTVRMFWISWAGGAISFGKGTIPESNRVLYYKDPSSHSINALSVMTPIGVKGNFTFGRVAG